MARKELLGSLMSNGIVITNPMFENEDLEYLNDVADEILESYSDENEEEEIEEEEEDVPVAEQELNGRVVGDTEVVHVLYPGVEAYPLLMIWTDRMGKEFDNVALRFVDELDAFVFYAGNEDEAIEIAAVIIEDLEAEEVDILETVEV